MAMWAHHFRSNLYWHILCRMLLWHGSRLTNWVRILAKGLIIAPPEAPVTGYVVSKWQFCRGHDKDLCYTSNWIWMKLPYYTGVIVLIYYRVRYIIRCNPTGSSVFSYLKLLQSPRSRRDPFELQIAVNILSSNVSFAIDVNILFYLLNLLM